MRRSRLWATWSLYCCSHPPPPNLHSRQVPPGAIWGVQECDPHILLKSCLSVWTRQPSSQNHPWEMRRENLRVREVGDFKMLPKTSRPENPWQTEELAALTPFSFLGSLLTALLLSPKVLFVQVEKQLEQQHLLSNANTLSQALGGAACSSESCVRLSNPGGPIRP